jgi:hypothetical protein
MASDSSPSSSAAAVQRIEQVNRTIDLCSRCHCLLDLSINNSSRIQTISRLNFNPLLLQASVENQRGDSTRIRQIKRRDSRSPHCSLPPSTSTITCPCPYINSLLVCFVYNIDISIEQFDLTEADIRSKVEHMISGARDPLYLCST